MRAQRQPRPVGQRPVDLLPLADHHPPPITPLLPSRSLAPLPFPLLLPSLFARPRPRARPPFARPTLPASSARAPRAAVLSPPAARERQRPSAGASSLPSRSRQPAMVFGRPHHFVSGQWKGKVLRCAILPPAPLPPDDGRPRRRLFSSLPAAHCRRNPWSWSDLTAGFPSSPFASHPSFQIFPRGCPEPRGRPQGTWQVGGGQSRRVMVAGSRARVDPELPGSRSLRASGRGEEGTGVCRPRLAPLRRMLTSPFTLVTRHTLAQSSVKDRRPITNIPIVRVRALEVDQATGVETEVDTECVRKQARPSAVDDARILTSQLLLTPTFSFPPGRSTSPTLSSRPSCTRPSRPGPAVLRSRVARPR